MVQCKCLDKLLARKPPGARLISPMPYDIMCNRNNPSRLILLKGKQCLLIWNLNRSGPKRTYDLLMTLTA